MVDLHKQDKGNISLPLKLQSYEDPENKHVPTIINTQRAFYDIRIADIENRINRLENRNDELLEEIETTDELVSTVDAETADEISNLSKQVYTQNNRVENLKNQINTIENDRINDKQSHEDNVELFNQKYKEKKVELVSQMKVLNAKINTLEDFKKMQTALEEKFEANSKRMIENEEKVKEVVKSISWKFEFDKEMLKGELYNCLLDLAAQFQIETDKYISLPNKRLMRENVMLENELLQISQEVLVKKEGETNSKNSAVEHRKNIIAYSSYIKQNIVIRKVQSTVLKALQKKYEKMKERLSLIKVPDPAMEKRCLKLIEDAQQEERKTNYYLSKLKSLLHKEKVKIGIVKYLQRRVECKIKAVTETLYDMKYIVTCLLKCPTMDSSYVRLLLSLQNKLIKGQSKLRCSTVKSVESVPHECRAIDLKEIPEDIDFEILTESEEKEPSYKEILKEIQIEKEREKEKEISTESSAFDEESLDKIFKDIRSYDTDIEEYELVEDVEFIQDEESLSDDDKE